MAQFKTRLQAFVKLGDFFRAFYDYMDNTTPEENDEKEWLRKFEQKLELAGHKNGWFTKENILFAVKSWGDLLNEQNLKDWLSDYRIQDKKAKTVAIIMAGNIPLVGFHDFLSALITGNSVLVKLSSNDTVILPFIAEYLIKLAPEMKSAISFPKEQLKDFDAVIATGSNNTTRYFEFYFGKKPNIIRRNRNSVAVLQGNETSEMLLALGEDIFRYYGLGCRSVSKIFVPNGYRFDAFFESVYAFKSIIDQAKYANNYDYNKAVYLMSDFKILDNGFLLLKEDTNYASPIATLFFEYYDSLELLKEKLEQDQELLQCIVARNVVKTEVNFGQTQQPSLTDYADGIDTVEFLLKT